MAICDFFCPSVVRGSSLLPALLSCLEEPLPASGIHSALGLPWGSGRKEIGICHRGTTALTPAYCEGDSPGNLGPIRLQVKIFRTTALTHALGTLQVVCVCWKQNIYIYLFKTVDIALKVFDTKVHF